MLVNTVDPEFFDEKIGDFPQKWIFGLPLLINTWAFWSEWKTLAALEKVKNGAHGSDVDEDRFKKN